MTTQEALLAAILANPDDDLPRYAYADWCEEMGNQARADMIRAQLADPNDNLTLPFDDAKFRWQRGFVCAVTCPLLWWIHRGRDYVRLHPIEQVVITDRRPTSVWSYASAGGYWDWQPMPHGHTVPATSESPTSFLPFSIYILVHYPADRVEPDRFTKRVHFQNEQAAMDALSEVCLKWARQAAVSGV